MIAFAEALVKPAADGNIVVPTDLENYNPAQFPHWHVYTVLQLGNELPRPDSHWTNAKIIGGLTEEQVLSFTLQDYINAGLETGFPLP